MEPTTSDQSSMWMSSPVVLDEPIKIYVFELDDVGVVTGVFLLANRMADGILTAFLAMSLAGAGLYLIKRGKPRGALLHLLHRLELMRLPGLMAPRRKRYDPW